MLFLLVKAGTLTLKEWRTLCGILVWICFLVPQARSRMYYFFQCLKAGERRLREAVARNQSTYNTPSSIVIKMSKQAVHDLHWWKEVLQNPPLYRPLIREEVEDEAFMVTTDGAPSQGIGGFWRNEAFSMELSEEGKKKHSTWVELFALVVATLIWGDQWRGQTIKWRTDCSSHVRGLFKIRTSAPELLELHDILDQLQFEQHFIFSAEHIPGDQNVLADALSRLSFEMLPSDWRIVHLPTTVPDWISTNLL